MTSVCTGSLVFAAAGLVSDWPGTTHWNYLDQLAALDPGIQVRPDERFVDDGDLITSSGVSAGIDMAVAPLNIGAQLVYHGCDKKLRNAIITSPTRLRRGR